MIFNRFFMTIKLSPQVLMQKSICFLIKVLKNVKKKLNNGTTVFVDDTTSETKPEET